MFFSAVLLFANFVCVWVQLISPWHNRGSNYVWPSNISNLRLSFTTCQRLWLSWVSSADTVGEVFMLRFCSLWMKYFLDFALLSASLGSDWTHPKTVPVSFYDRNMADQLASLFTPCQSLPTNPAPMLWSGALGYSSLPWASCFGLFVLLVLWPTLWRVVLLLLASWLATRLSLFGLCYGFPVCVIVCVLACHCVYFIGFDSVFVRSSFEFCPVFLWSSFGSGPAVFSFCVVLHVAILSLI